MARVIDYTTRDLWLDARRLGLGASDAPAVMGHSPWVGPYQVWLDKLGLLIRSPMSEAQKLGLVFESVIADLYEQQTNQQLHDPGDYTIWHGDDPLQATLDRYESQTGKIVEIKTAGSDRDWRNGPPLHYQIQVQHQMAVAPAADAAIAVLFGSPAFHFRIYTVPRNDRFISVLNRRCREFWELVESETPPDVDDSEITERALKRMRAETGEQVELPTEATEWLILRQSLTRGIKDMEKRRRAFDNKIRAAFGTAEIGMLDGQKVATYAADSRGVRKLLIKNGKP